MSSKSADQVLLTSKSVGLKPVGCYSSFSKSFFVQIDATLTVLSPCSEQSTLPSEVKYSGIPFLLNEEHLLSSCLPFKERHFRLLLK